MTELLANGEEVPDLDCADRDQSARPRWPVIRPPQKRSLTHHLTIAVALVACGGGTARDGGGAGGADGGSTAVPSHGGTVGLDAASANDGGGTGEAGVGGVVGSGGRSAGEGGSGATGGSKTSVDSGGTGDPRAAYTDCAACAGVASCGWCIAAARCMSIHLTVDGGTVDGVYRCPNWDVDPKVSWTEGYGSICCPSSISGKCLAASTSAISGGNCNSLIPDGPCVARRRVYDVEPLYAYDVKTPPQAIPQSGDYYLTDWIEYGGTELAGDFGTTVCTYPTRTMRAMMTVYYFGGVYSIALAVQSGAGGMLERQTYQGAATGSGGGPVVLTQENCGATTNYLASSFLPLTTTTIFVGSIGTFTLRSGVGGTGGSSGTGGTGGTGGAADGGGCTPTSTTGCLNGSTCGFFLSGASLPYCGTCKDGQGTGSGHCLCGGLPCCDPRCQD
jgi:hypothetical protein